jgi:arylsulfatase A-like enzyme
VILGADVRARRIDSLVSQIDLAPTLVSLMGVDGEHPFAGRDLTRTLPEVRQLARAGARQGDDAVRSDFAGSNGIC